MKACRDLATLVRDTTHSLQRPVSFPLRFSEGSQKGSLSAAHNTSQEKKKAIYFPVACRSMNMKVHQTLVWLNLLSFGTKDLAAPTIGIQSAANHYTFHNASPFCLYDTSVPSFQLLLTELLAVQYGATPPPPPLPTWPRVARCYFTATFAKNHTHFPIF